MTAEQAQQIIDLLNQGPRQPLWSFFIIPATTLLGALIGSTVAVIAILSQRATAKRKATLDAIMQFESDPIYRRAISTYKLLRERDLRIDSITAPTTDAERAYLGDLNTFWNWHELMALGLRRETLDDEIMLRWWGEPMVRTWNDSVPAIDAFREKQNTNRMFKNYEVVAREFATKLRKTGKEIAFVEPEQRNDLPYKVKDRFFGVLPPDVTD